MIVPDRQRRAARSAGFDLLLQTGRGAPRRWRLAPGAARCSTPLRCKPEQWFIVQASAAGPLPRVLVRFARKRGADVCRVVLLERASANACPLAFGWVQAPVDARSVRFEAADGSACRVLVEPALERDPKCHPLANVPRWSTHQPAFPIERVVLPVALEKLRPLLVGPRIELLKRPRSLRHLAARAIGAACVIDPDWLAAPGLTLRDFERIVPASWLIVDLGSMVRLVRQARIASVTTVSHRRVRGLMSARVEYADVATRGFALQDVFPYGTLNEQGEFGLRAIRHDRQWKRYAAPRGVATLLASETPWPGRGGNILSAARSEGRGELIATDLPWLLAGDFGPLAAPRAALHALRAHLGLPIADGARYWTRWEELRVVVRDISDLPRRFPPLRIGRWAGGDGAMRLGVLLDGPEGPPRRTLTICTGRADLEDAHDGLPPEPMILFMRWLGREVSEGVAWTRKALAATRVVWQFDTHGGHKYGVLFGATDAARAPRDADRTLDVRFEPRGPHSDAPAATRPPSSRIRAVGPSRWHADPRLGLLGDGSLDFQAELTARLRAWLMRAGD